MGCCQTDNELRNENIKKSPELYNQNKKDLLNNCKTKEPDSLTNSKLSLNINQKGDINRYKDIINFEELQ